MNLISNTKGFNFLEHKKPSIKLEYAFLINCVGMIQMI